MAMLVDVTPLPRLVAERAASDPDRPFLADAGREFVTYGEVWQRTRACVTQLRGLGVEPGAVVASLLPASVEAVVLWLAVGALGGIEAALNPAYRGELLRRLLADTGAATVVTDVAGVANVSASLSDTQVERLLVVGTDGGAEPASAACEVSRVDALGAGHPPCDATGLPESAAHDIGCLIYTSGTTGPSKAVLVPWTQLHMTAVALLADLPGEDDCGYVPAPLFHVGGKGPVYLTALTGGRAVLRPSFKTQAFWPDVLRHECTVSFLGGAMANFLLDGQSPRVGSHRLRDVLMVPLIPRLAEFRQRFGVRVCTAYNMTEISSPIVSGWVTDADGSCGVVRDGYECRVVDAADEQVEDGQTGELLVRADRPWALFAGYRGRPEDTVRAWRNLWFHTGDSFRCVGGRYFFVDRLKDTIRRRGENISSTEVEELTGRHAGVTETAAIGVASEWGEEELLLFVRLAPGSTVSVEELHRTWLADLPAFMVPRYVEVVDDFPRTPNAKIMKAALRARGVGPSTWDSGHGVRRSVARLDEDEASA